MLKTLPTLLIVSAAVCSLRPAQQASGATPATAECVKRSNDHAQVPFNINACFFPEGASAAGVAGLDDQIIDLKLRFQGQSHEARGGVPMLVAAVAGAEEHEHAEGKKLGTVHFATSCNAAAQKEFDRAVALLHSFQFHNAIQGFQGALKADPACGAAY